MAAVALSSFHHCRVPYVAGGDATVDLITLRGAAHNRYEADLDSGEGRPLGERDDRPDPDAQRVRSPGLREGGTDAVPSSLGPEPMRVPRPVRRRVPLADDLVGQPHAIAAGHADTAVVPHALLRPRTCKDGGA